MRGPTLNEYPRETNEIQWVTVTQDGETVTTGVTLAATLGTARPTSWTAPVADAGRIGLRVQSLAPGLYTAWAKIDSDLEDPVVRLGQFYVT